MNHEDVTPVSSFFAEGAAGREDLVGCLTQTDL